MTVCWQCRVKVRVIIISVFSSNAGDDTAPYFSVATLLTRIRMDHQGHKYVAYSNCMKRCRWLLWKGATIDSPHTGHLASSLDNCSFYEGAEITDQY